MKPSKTSIRPDAEQDDGLIKFVRSLPRGQRIALAKVFRATACALRTDLPPSQPMHNYKPGGGQ